MSPYKNSKHVGQFTLHKPKAKSLFKLLPHFPFDLGLSSSAAGLPHFIFPMIPYLPARSPFLPAVWLVSSPVIWIHLVSLYLYYLNLFVSLQTCLPTNFLLFWSGSFLLVLPYFFLSLLTDFLYFCYVISFVTL